MIVTLVAAVAENGVIGREGGLPWRLSSDLKRFKADTMGKPIAMGRRTWESFPNGALPGRLNIVITRDEHYDAPGARLAGSVAEALELAAAQGAEEVAVIGGGEIFEQAMPIADRLIVTHVLAAIEGDTHFPAIDAQTWYVYTSEDVPAGERDSHATRRIVYLRKQPG
jgi:dihydrofolate reductase